MKIKIFDVEHKQGSIYKKNFWKYLKELDFDIGLFQEVYIIPHEKRKNYHIVQEMNAILLKIHECRKRKYFAG